MVESLSLRVDSGQATIADDIKIMKDTIFDNILVENRKMSAKINLMESKIIELEQNVNIIAQKSKADSVSIDSKIVELERERNIILQRARENNVEFQGISHDISDEKLEDIVLEIAKLLDIDNVDKRCIEGCHRLPLRDSNSCKPVLVKFVNRKIAELIIDRKYKLKDMDFEEIGLPADSEIFVNINLSQPFKSLDYFCRKLRKDELIFSSFTSHTMVKIRLNEGGRYKKITHVSDLITLFPDVKFVEKFKKRR